MNGKKLLFGIFVLIIIATGCGRNSSGNLFGNSSASWAFQFVVLNNNTYQVTDEIISHDKIEEKIGEVTHYSDKEGTYSNGFSNKYEKGTELYKIKGMDVNKYIAVKENDNTYKKLKKEGI